MPERTLEEEEEGADAEEGKVTNCGDVSLTESLRTARTAQSHFSQLDAIIDESRVRLSVPVIPDPGVAVDPNQLGRIVDGARVFPRHAISGQSHETCLRYTSSSALWSQQPPKRPTSPSSPRTR